MEIKMVRQHRHRPYRAYSMWRRFLPWLIDCRDMRAFHVISTTHTQRQTLWHVSYMHNTSISLWAHHFGPRISLTASVAHSNHEVIAAIADVATDAATTPRHIAATQKKKQKTIYDSRSMLFYEYLIASTVFVHCCWAAVIYAAIYALARRQSKRAWMSIDFVCLRLVPQ